MRSPTGSSSRTVPRTGCRGPGWLAGWPPVSRSHNTPLRSDLGGVFCDLGVTPTARRATSGTPDGAVGLRRPAGREARGRVRQAGVLLVPRSQNLPAPSDPGGVSCDLDEPPATCRATSGRHLRRSGRARRPVGRPGAASAERAGASRRLLYGRAPPTSRSRNLPGPAHRGGRCCDLAGTPTARRATSGTLRRCGQRATAGRPGGPGPRPAGGRQCEDTDSRIGPVLAPAVRTAAARRFVRFSTA